MLENEAIPFEVSEEVEVADLTNTKEVRTVLPVTKGLKFRIEKAAIASNENKEKGKKADVKGLKLELRVVDGIETTDPSSGNTEHKFVNFPLFTGLFDLVYWYDTSVVSNNKKHGGKTRAEIDWWKNDQARVEFKKFCQALELPLSGLRINDEFLSSLIGREVLVDVGQEPETVENPQTGERVATGNFNNRLRNWKKAA